MEPSQDFEAERPRLVRLAAGVLRDPVEAEDVVQQAWLRLQATEAHIDRLPAWLTTVTTRLCLDRLRSRVPEPVEVVDGAPGATRGPGAADDVADRLALAETLAEALHLVLDRLTPRERVAFVLHDGFGVDFVTIGSILDCAAPTARKLASRARGKVRGPVQERPRPAWEVVDAFMAAAREGDFAALLGLLAPGVVVAADLAATTVGTPERIDGREQVATFFDGSARAALPVWTAGRPGFAWYHRGEARVVFDFAVDGGEVVRITFRAAPEVLAKVSRRVGER